ncbi:DUF6252 family protein [Psychroserpens ponticola]|uniref:DUF6252 family protein n=1 Tax=Psychroserpens ponticola TaxID=2932268 RepID=A0ABY7RVW3_9FLAO|nr:DUF6252 family protein [Psychroserpens ponticola]WCO00973.1 DUF6252 family protein [Psychroserpens ponticola]
MRHFKNFMILVMTLTALTLTSCSSSDDSGDGGGSGGGAGSGVLVAKVNGNSYQSMAISSTATVANNGQSLIIIASNSSGKAFSFTVLDFNGEGTYPIGGGANIANSASYTVTDVDLNNPQNSTTEIWQAPYDDTEVGEIVVTSVTDSKVKGTFNFTCKNVGGDQSLKTITNGSFNLDKQVVN